MKGYKKFMAVKKSIEKRKLYQEKLERKIHWERSYEDSRNSLQEYTEKGTISSIGLKIRRKRIRKIYAKESKEQFKKAGEFLIKYNKLNKYVEMQNNDYEKIQMPGMKYTEEEAQKIFTDEYIDKLEPLQLAILNAFWQNRFTKEAMILEKIYLYLIH